MTPLTTRLIAQAVCVLAVGAVSLLPSRTGARALSAAHPLDLFQACVALSAADFARLEDGLSVVHALDEQDDDVALFGARRISADGDRLVAWIRQIADLKRSPFVEAIARFSEPPVAGDLAGLSLDPSEQQALRDCRPGDCRLKLTRPEIEFVRREMAGAGRQWRGRSDEVFRSLMLDRIRAYQSGGHQAIGRYDDGRSPESLSVVATALLERSACLTDRVPALRSALVEGPPAFAASSGAFLYWSKERVGGRPIASMTHVTVVRTGPDGGDAIVAGKQVSATHYLTGSLNITAVVGVGTGTGHYVVILNRSRLDVLGGMFGGLVRRSIERRLRGELSGILHQMARRLESGPPPVPKYSWALVEAPSAASRVD